LVADGVTPADWRLDLPSPFHVLRLDRVPSTNTEALRQAALGAAPGLVVVAQEQTAGRGRSGRHWISPGGNLYCSVVWRPQVEPARVAEAAFVAAIAVAEAVSAVLPNETAVSCKWPNDVLINGLKVAGILLEAESRTASSVDCLVIGIGVNVTSYPPVLPAGFTATSLAAAGAGDLEVPGLLKRLVESLAGWLRRWEREGFAPVRTAWLARAHALGGLIRVAQPSGDSLGRFRGLDDEGALLLETDGGMQRIIAGDVFPLAAAG
jgi:BirA family biotin operon repressor/biotin-[acetyl-CoA-carboxylase] ligase